MPPSPIAAFLAHIERARNVTLPGDHIPLRCDGAPIGWLLPKTVMALAPLLPEGAVRPEGVTLAHGEFLRPLGEAMASAGMYRPHDELFDVFDTQGRTLGTIDRGALPLLGLAAKGVHMNGLVRRPDGIHLWIGHRAATKRLDPGKLDHLVAGGVSAGFSALETLVKEAGEEAAIPPELAGQAVQAGRVSYVMSREEGLRRDTLLCFDLHLPESFVPEPRDGEVAFFECVPIETAFALVRDTDRMKFNVNLVLIDLFIRLGLFEPDGAQALRRALDNLAASAP